MSDIDPIDELLLKLASFSKDPYGFVLWAFPWGEPGELENSPGPEEWQKEELLAIGAGLKTIDDVIRFATKSGHGIGKSALVSWLILWAMSTFEDTKGVVTANTENQLKTKTWAELAKWHRLFIAKDLFKFTATALFSADKAHEKTWKIDMVPWSERNTEAFAGLHNQGKRILLIMDEASAIPDLIHEVAEGALTDKNTEILWFCFGNPTRNVGRFRQYFDDGTFAHRWRQFTVDSRTVSFTNHKQIEEWIEDYGVDSDFVNVRVRGNFPKTDSDSFISLYAAKMAAERPGIPVPGEPVVLGVDVGRFGDDPSVIYPRRGRDAKTLPIEIMYGADTMQVALRVKRTFEALGAVVVFVDGGGVGGGVADRLRQLRIPIIEIDSGSKPSNDDPNDRSKYGNKRAELWGRGRTWLNTGAIPERISGYDVTLIDELTSPRYGLNNKDAIVLESKRDMRSKRGIKSTNIADALFLTMEADAFSTGLYDTEQVEEIVQKEYDPFEVFANELF